MNPSLKGSLVLFEQVSPMHCELWLAGKSRSPAPFSIASFKGRMKTCCAAREKRNGYTEGSPECSHPLVCTILQMLLRLAPCKLG